jgi:hypothetical protein
VSFDRKHSTITLKRNQSRVFHFPGGSIELARTSEGDHWAHIAIVTARHTQDAAEIGTPTDGRIDRDNGKRPETIDDLAPIDHVAIRISSPQDRR